MTDIDITYGTARVYIDPASEDEVHFGGRTRRHVVWHPSDAVTALTIALGALGTTLSDEAIEHVQALVKLDASGGLLR